MRADYPDKPEKFMESELELDDEIKKLEVIATAPNLYPILVKVKTADVRVVSFCSCSRIVTRLKTFLARHVQSLLTLLTHDNTDISLDVIRLLNEMLDPEVIVGPYEAVSLHNVIATCEITCCVFSVYVLASASVCQRSD
jgi:beta-catenin-like protein 1